ncbi:MAG TPA: hypothetical protein VI112_18025 [Bacteroidia bacterium]|jgi:hypothetical protein
MEVHDHIVVGSGCTGAMAAQTLVEAGARVTMLDVGLKDEKYSSLIPPVDFTRARETDKEQSRYLLGDEFEALRENEIATGAQLTPPRFHMAKQVLDAIHSEDLFPMESFAYGGLGSGWGLGCCMFSDAELEACGLNAAEMKNAYRVVAERIGVSGTKDDAAPYTCASLDGIMPSIEMDNNGSTLFKVYSDKRKKLNENGFFLGRPSLALLTEDRDARKKYAYRDLDFYSDKEQSAYRPWITVNELRKKNNFNYIPGKAVISFSERDNGIEVKCFDAGTKEMKSYLAKKLVLAPGVLQTARIVLRSLGGDRVPLLCNPYCYIPAIQWRMLGKQLGEKKTGFAQLSLFHDPQRNNMDVAMASIYSYNSLMMFRIIKQVPLDHRNARVLMQYLMPAFSIFGIHHPEKSSAQKFLQRKAGAGEGGKFFAEYRLSEEEKMKMDVREKGYLRAIKQLGCYPIKRIDPGMGSSIHYAGTLPFSENNRFSIFRNGRLNGTQNIFVADGSGFRYLPAKGLTFSLMANAHNVAKNCLND